MSLLDLGAADSLLSGEWDDLADAEGGAGGVGMKTGAGGHPQPYDSYGRYTGPTGGVYDRATGEIRTFGGEDDGGEDDGDDMGFPARGLAASDAEAARQQDAEPAVYTLDSDGEPLATTADGDAGDALDVIPASDEGLSGGNEVRGRVGPQEPPYPPPPPAPKEPHLVYSLEREAGTLRDPQGQVLTDKGYSGYGVDRNKATSQNKENLGPIPEGNWRIREVMDPNDNTRLNRPIYRLEPDPGTRARFGEGKIERKPDSMLIHGGNDPQTSSRGCIILDKGTRVNLKQYEGRWIRVVK
jgi:hypothetical protein